MKNSVLWISVFWLAILLESSGAQLFPAASLTLPLAVACLFYEKDSRSVLMAGLTLLVRWFLNPQWPPVEIAVTIAASVWLLQRQLDREHRFGATSGVSAASVILMSFTAVAIVLALQVFGGSESGTLLRQYSLTSLPLIALLAAFAALKRNLVVR